MSVRPRMAGPSRVCPRKSQAISDISTMPMPDHIAYAIPTGMVREARERKKKAAP